MPAEAASRRRATRVRIAGNCYGLADRHNEVYAVDIVNWTLLARIPVDHGPHGLTVWPQPGRYSTGHTGVMR
ncbi:hypothetical protein [Nocardia neocaledoniensis]|uniref:hypothetical protein n=1 Tax=Nocardia neocaledoniensis TaxID=236511 RepID=UPI002454C68C|nr:hypothetical protein [Nocardia neocaledoniensis]